MRPGLLCPGRAASRRVAAAAMAASMRPGLLCPGRPQTTRCDLQRGASFNEAGAFMPRKGR